MLFSAGGERDQLLGIKAHKNYRVNKTKQTTYTTSMQKDLSVAVP